MRPILITRVFALVAVATTVVMGGVASAQSDDVPPCDGIGSLVGFNSAPLAVDDEAWVEPNGSVEIDVLANDIDFDGDDLVISATTPATRGNASIEGSVIVYEPGLDAEGEDTFTYRISDGSCGMDQAQVRVQVSPTPPPPDEAPPAPPVTQLPKFTG